MPDEPEGDGRRARAQRTRNAIVTALLELALEGEVAPSAQAIATKAGVSARSVYQHMVDMEGLYAEASERANRFIRSLAIEVDRSLPLTKRIEVLIANRAASLEKVRPITKAGVVTENTSAVVRENRREMNLWAKERVAMAFAPELDALAPELAQRVLGALDGLTSAEAWNHWRDAGLTPREAHGAMQFGVTAVLASARSAAQAARPDGA